MKTLFFNLFIILSLFSCKTDSIEKKETPLLFAVHSALIYEGDSLQLSFTESAIAYANVQFSATIGNINATGIYIAPTQIEQDTLQTIITCSFNNQQTQTKMLITKKAFTQSPVSYGLTIQPLLNNNCNFSGCHGNGSRAGKVELSMYDSVFKNIIQYNASASKVYYSLIKTDPLRVMPPAGKLHDDKIQAVWLWIEQGARNN